MIDANASNIENAIMVVAIGGVLLVPAIGLIYGIIAFLRRRRHRPPAATSFFDVIGRP